MLPHPDSRVINTREDWFTRFCFFSSLCLGHESYAVRMEIYILEASYKKHNFRTNRLVKPTFLKVGTLLYSPVARELSFLN